MLLVLPRSTLFPYTTLFRSELEYIWAVRAVGPAQSGRAQQSKLVVYLLGEMAQHGDAAGGDRVGHVDAIGLYRADRKSTRLNSSHLGISYAVFCLKKKKKRA